MSHPVSTFVIIGLTGVGKSSAVQQLETLGFLGIDAIPPDLVLPTLAQLQPSYAQVAVVVQLQRPDAVIQFEQVAMALGQQRIPIIFLEASDAVIVRRLSAGRRRHPYLSPTTDLMSAIEQERDHLAPVRQLTTHVLDTSDLTPTQLLHRLEKIALGWQPMPLTLSLLSFGYKYGLPVDANLVFDVRFLPNPYFVPQLRPLTGQDKVLQEYLFSHFSTQQTYEQIRNLVWQFLPNYQAERRSQLTVAIGCTGGQHRSVTLVERLALELSQIIQTQDPPPFHLQVTHRHLATSQQEIAIIPGVKTHA